MKKHPFLVIVALAAISLQCSIANNNLAPIPDPGQVPTTDELANEEIQEAMEASIEDSPLAKIIQQMDAFLEDLKAFEIETKSGKGHNLVSLLSTKVSIQRVKKLMDSVKQRTIKFLKKEEDINDYLYFILQKRARNLSGRRCNINMCRQGQVSSFFFYPTSLLFFKFLNNTLSKEGLRINKQARIKTISVYEFFQLLIKETLLLCDIESLNKKTIDILRASVGLHDLITNPTKADLGHPDEFVAPYHVLESILLGYPKPIKDDKQRQDINREIMNIKREIRFDKLIKDKNYINSKHKLIRHLIYLLFSEDTTNPRLLDAIKYLSKDLDGEIIRNHFHLNKDTKDTYELDKKSNYVQSKWPYPLPKPVFLEKAIAKYGPDPMPIKMVKLKPTSNLQRHKPKPNVHQRHKPKSPTDTKTKKKQRSGNRTTIHNFTNAPSPANKELEKKEKVFNSIDTYSQYVKEPTSLSSSTPTNLVLPTDEAPKKADIDIIFSQPLQEKASGSIETHLHHIEDSIILSSINLTNPQSPNDEVLEEKDIEDHSIYYDDYNEYKDRKNYENKKLIKDSEKNITEPEKETWKQPAGARRFNANLLNTRATDFIPITHQATVNKIFDSKRQCKVKFSEFVTLWEGIGGKLTGNMHGGSHRKIIAPTGEVVTGIFTHGNGTMYGKKSIQYLKMALEYVGLQPTE